MADQTDKSTRILTISDCEQNIKTCQEKLGNYIDSKDQDDAQIRLQAEIGIWARMIHHINNGEIVTINDKNQLHWVSGDSNKTIN